MHALQITLSTLLACSALALPSPGLPQEGDAPAEAAFRKILKERAELVDPREAGIGLRVPDLTFTEIEGGTGRLSDYAERPEHRALVICVRQIGCPVGERYAPRMARLEGEYAERGVDFLFVNMDTFVKADEVAEQERGVHGLRGRYVHDPDETFGRALGAETTTVVYVLDRSRTLRYRGAIDDQYGRGVVLPEPRTHYLRDALDAVLAHRPVELASTSAPGCLLDIARAVEPTPAEEIDYHGEVARVLQRNCVKCHRPDGPAPFSLEDFETAYDKRRMIGMVVDAGIMPPWYATDETGPWANDTRLSGEERRMIDEWVARGAPEGDPADGPEPLVWKGGWQIGEPDEVFQFDAPRQLPASGTVEWEHIEIERVVPRDLWIKRLQILPSDPQVVHHASAEFLPPPQEVTVRGRDLLLGSLAPWSKPAPSVRPQRWQYLFGYLPGKGPRSYRENVARFLPEGSRIRFGMHYTPKGEATADLTSLGLVLADEPTDFLAETTYMHAIDVEIPPGEQAEFSNEIVVPYDVVLRSITPHMHLRGVSFQSHLIHLDGTEELLLDIPAWDQDWQNSYVFAQEPVVPRGTRLRITGKFDNSSANPNNPDPTRHVVFGQQIWDEMLTMAVEWIRPRDEALRQATRSNPNAAPSVVNPGGH